MEKLSKKTVRMFDTVILIKRSRLRNSCLHVRLLKRDDPMVCDHCDGTDIGAFYLEDLKLTHCICSCGKEWVE
jgi:hypothetical protein